MLLSARQKNLVALAAATFMQDDDNFQHVSERLYRLALNPASRPARVTPALGADFIRHARPARHVVTHILLIERDGDVREALAGLLRMHRWHVTAVAEPAEAYAGLRAGPAPDLILIDSSHANSVMEFLQQAAAHGTPLAHVPVIAMVATDHTPTGEVLTVLKKPFAIAPLLKLIRDLG